MNEEMQTMNGGEYPAWGSLYDTADPDATLPAFTTLDESEVTNALEVLK